MGTISHIAPNVAGRTVVLHLMDAIDDAQQLAEDYNAAADVHDGLRRLYDTLDAMRFGDCSNLGEVLSRIALKVAPA